MTHVEGYPTLAAARQALFAYAALGFTTLLIEETPFVHVAAGGDLPWPNAAGKDWWLVIATQEEVQAGPPAEEP